MLSLGINIESLTFEECSTDGHMMHDEMNNDKDVDGINYSGCFQNTSTKRLWSEV